MSDSDCSSEDLDTSNFPPADECDRRCKSFAAITDTDPACAMYFLQGVDYDLQRGLNIYYETKAKIGSADSAENTSAKDEACVEQDTKPHRIRILTWNTDGIDTNNVLTRARAVSDIILQEKPHVVFLQEVVLKSLDVYTEKCPQYQVLCPGTSAGYFCIMLLRTDSIVLKDQLVHSFFSTTMGRNLFHVKVSVKGVDMHLLTSHLESMANHADERKVQLTKAFHEVQSAPNNVTVVFGGDLNLRDKELEALGGIPKGLLDLWEATGKRPEAKFTWDTMKNDNLDMGLKFKPRCRFDRVYLRHPKEGPHVLKPMYFELVGIQRLQSCKRFPSDHWGILTHFDKV